MEHQDQTERDRQARDIFLRAAEIHPPEAQAAYLEGACQKDASLRSRVDALLENHRQDTFLEHAALGPRPTIRIELPLTEAPDTKIGRYKLLEKLGEGGFGSVWAAEQREPVKRRVALKIIKLGMDTKQVVARFEAERQALAMMDHPNIAKVLDAGATDNGRPYFVMELVKGIPITKYCDQVNLSTKDRLDLFIKVCQAIQHAHQKGIIHRDIKPSNIMVTLHDGVPVPKVIDFGIAKATQQELTELTIYTQHHQFIGTPAYMSPEQAEMSGLDIDTRSDIYSLGVLLYELLTGRTPFDAKDLMQSGLDEMRRIIREQEPVRPSTKLSQTLAATPAEGPGNSPRRTPHSAIETDLDWIVMKCLEKDRARRYDTANGLAADLKRHLSNEPVVARPPSAAYKLQKAYRRNRIIFTAAACIVVSLVIAIVFMWVAARREGMARVRESIQRNLAEQRTKEAQSAQKVADAARDDAEALAYASAINLAQQALANENLGQAVELLDRQRPQPGRPDRRGWEWRYLWQQCRSDALSSPLVLSNRFREFTISPDGRWLVAAVEDDTGGLALLDVSDPRRLRLIERIASDAAFAHAAFSPNGELLAFSVGDPATVRTNSYFDSFFQLRLWNTRTRQIVGEATLSNRCLGLSFSSDGRRLLTYNLYRPDNSPTGKSPTGPIGVWEVAGLKRIVDPPDVRLPSLNPTGWEFALTRDWSALANTTEGPDGSGRIQVVELTTGTLRWESPQSDRVGALKFSPDQSLLVAAEGYNGAPRVRIWNAASGVEIGLGIGGCNEAISALAFWPDGKTLATAGVDQTIRLWDLTDPAHPKPIGRPLRGHQSEVWQLALLPDGRTLVSVDRDGAFLAWDTQQARPDRTRLKLAFASDLADWQFNPDSKSILAVEEVGRVTRLSGPDFAIREELVKLRTVDWENSTRFSKDGRFVAQGSTNGTIQLWDLERRTLVKGFEGGTGRTTPFAFRGDNQKLIVWSGDNHLTREWDLAAFKEVASWQDLRGPSYLSRDERWFFTFGDGYPDGRFLARDLVNGTQTIRTNLELQIESPGDWDISPDGKLLAVSSRRRAFVRLFDRATLRPIDTLRGFLQEATSSVCFSPDGKRLAASSGGREAMRLWDAERRHTLVTLEASSRVNFEASHFSPDGNLLGAVGQGDDKSIHLWRAPSWAEIEQAEAATGKPPTP